MEYSDTMLHRTVLATCTQKPKKFARWRYQMDVRQLGYSVWSSSSECGTGWAGVQSVIYDWLAFSRRAINQAPKSAAHACPARELAIHQHINQVSGLILFTRRKLVNAFRRGL